MKKYCFKLNLINNKKLKNIPKAKNQEKLK